MMENDDSSVVTKFEISLTDDARVVIYDHRMLIVQATDRIASDEEKSFITLDIGCSNEIIFDEETSIEHGPYMYIYIYVCVCVRVCVCVCVCIRTSMHAYIHTCVYKIYSEHSLKIK
jgi:hypothetical protein